MPARHTKLALWILRGMVLPLVGGAAMVALAVRGAIWASVALAIFLALAILLPAALTLRADLAALDRLYRKDDPR